MAPGLFSRLFDMVKGAAAPPGTDRQFSPKVEPQPAAANFVRVLPSWSEDVEVSGESYRRTEMRRLFVGLGRPEGGVTMQIAVLELEPKNLHDHNAVKVVIRGEHVGYVPAELSARVAKQCRAVGRAKIPTVLARVWATNDDGVWRGRVTLSFSGESERERDFAAERREQEDRDSARRAEQARRQAERERKEAQKAARLAAGSVRGEYWTTFKSTIAELKRQSRLTEALELLQECVAAAEREAVALSAPPNPWPTEQSAAVMRRMKEHRSELAVLERYVKLLGDAEIPDGVQSKLLRARTTVGGLSEAG